jgi:signal transduction histidine kinase
LPFTSWILPKTAFLRTLGNIHIEVIEDLQNDRLHMSVSDDGRGMDAETVAKVTDPFMTSRTTRKVGLGIPLTESRRRSCRGYLTIQSELEKGRA